MVNFKDVAVGKGPEELTLRIGETRGQKPFVDSTRIDRNGWSFSLVDSNRSALCLTLYEMDREDCESTYNTLQEEVNKANEYEDMAQGSHSNESCYDRSKCSGAKIGRRLSEWRTEQ